MERGLIPHAVRGRMSARAVEKHHTVMQVRPPLLLAELQNVRNKCVTEYGGGV